MTSTIGCVPLDILQEIFRNSVQISRRDAWNEESLVTSWKAPMSVPLCLSQVCWLWREVALTCPSLWTDITVIVDGTSDRERDQRLVEAFDSLVRRSRSLPLNLSVTCNTYGLSEQELDTAAYVLRRLLYEQLGIRTYRIQVRPYSVRVGTWYGRNSTTVFCLPGHTYGDGAYRIQP
ncbi:uncharacterized protein FOMMEDRAFT_160490 [Fomitiporia mediterranea MF3/22]|uniref:uncharacterized protein n=1 Tax=Fomitiporia mediterranea (strain MF3/22) TaxID=694068 RepID=UPI0004409377|nr:uncharacterized protein FOMMEDRAFT_160490 [Fomitiporia mediterranea MF3/22]EJC99439.1 hypothetical protein FOMMEDRAFT_160490 [Fomitiporia mediterranea MF3/22]